MEVKEDLENSVDINMIMMMSCCIGPREIISATCCQQIGIEFNFYFISYI